MSIGIYAIVNNKNNKMYFGQSVHIEKRIQAHRCSLISKTHRNQHLQSAWDEKEGKDFVFSVVEVCKIEELDTKERYYINQYSTDNPVFGYNFTTGGESKHRHTEESRKKMSESHLGKSSGRKGKKATPEQIEKNRLTHLGRGHSEETKKKLSDMFKGRKGISRPHTEEAKKKIGDASRGRKHTQETKEKMSLVQLARHYVPTKETIQKLIAASSGRIQSPETREKRSASLMGNKRSNSSSKYIGVHLSKRDKLWVSIIYYERAPIYIGWFKSEIDAATAYNNKAIELYGNQAKLNRIPENE